MNTIGVWEEYIGLVHKDDKYPVEVIKMYDEGWIDVE